MKPQFALVLALLTSCATAPKRQPQVELPPSFSQSSAPVETEAPWWSAFDAPKLASTIERTLLNNRDLRAAEARVRQAEAQARAAGADVFPSVGSSVAGSRQKQILIGFPTPDGRPFSSTSERWGVALNVSWEADLWGRLRAQRRAAVMDLEAARLEAEAARLSLSGQTAKAWFSWSEANEQHRLAQETVETRQAQLRRIETRYQRGVAGALDLRLARSNTATARAQLAARRQQLTGARLQLQYLLGEVPSAEPAAAPGLPPVPHGSGWGVPSELLRRRPDLVAAERRLIAAGARLDAARAALFPRLSLQAGGGTAAEDFSDILDGDFSVWNLAANLLQPVFQGGRLRAGVEYADADEERLLAAYEAGVLRAMLEVELALSAERDLAERALALQTAADESRRATGLAEQRYFSGLDGYLLVLSSQAQHLQAESALLAARAAQLNARVDLHLAIGGALAPTAPTQDVR